MIRQRTPPCGGFDTPLSSGAYDELAKKGLNIYPPSGAVLERAVQSAEMFDLILMPHAMYWQRNSGERPSLALCASANPLLAIGGTGLSITPFSLCCSNTWYLPNTPMPYGDIALVEDNRTAITRVVHRWQPQIKVDSAPGSGPHISATFTLQARAALGSSSFRTSVWDPAPPAVFETTWDAALCSIGWQVTGQYTDGCKTTTYHGNGLETFDPNTGHGFLRAVADASGVHVELDVTAPIRYTADTVDSCDSSTNSSEVTDSINVWKYDVPLSGNWTIGAASFTLGTVWPRQISWNAAPAQPPFDANAEPR